MESQLQYKVTSIKLILKIYLLDRIILEILAEFESKVSIYFK